MASPETATTSPPATAPAPTPTTRPLPRLPEDFLREQEQLLAAAREDLAADPKDLEALIWVGRRLAYLGHYDEAIEVFTQGLAEHPREAKLYRHRGHRFITTRQFERAAVDLERAVWLVRDQVDETEPDGLPNVRGIPLSTTQFNIWYHLGLAYYLQGAFEHALRAYEECLELSGNPDLLSATTHWLYMTLRRLGREEEAGEVLEPINAEMEIIENEEYHRLLLMYKGELVPEQLLDDARIEGGRPTATVAYGVGNWYLYNDLAERAHEIFAEIEGGDQWSSFGYIAAEAELERAAAEEATQPGE
ncbi:MAG: tetratricopeptide repeat protein [Acidobacteria bacterium]|nr:MAG: tetratricopeptide repeat protein [Acidobacteriota bacterium]